MPVTLRCDGATDRRAESIYLSCAGHRNCVGAQPIGSPRSSPFLTCAYRAAHRSENIFFRSWCKIAIALIFPAASLRRLHKRFVLKRLPDVTHERNCLHLSEQRG